jgi:hypothetical protein
VSPRWLRLEPGRRENLLAAGAALGAAAGVAAVVFYFGRILISRERVYRLGELEAEEREAEEGSMLAAPPATGVPERTRRR